MAEPLQNKIKESLQATEGLYHRLVLLVGEAQKPEILNLQVSSSGVRLIPGSSSVAHIVGTANGYDTF